MPRMSKKDVEAGADEIIDLLALLEARLANAKQPVLKALSGKLAAIYAQEMLGYEIPESMLPKNDHRWWCLNHVDLMKPIRDVYLSNIEADFSEGDVRLMFDPVEKKKTALP